MSDFCGQRLGMASKRAQERMINRLRAHGIRNEEVLSVMNQVPRHLFVSEALMDRAYDDTALPLVCGQTISQPYVVAKMIELLLEKRLDTLSKVLEVGAGCGYQAAVLSFLFREVYTIERLRPLYLLARENLRTCGLSRVNIRYGDGMIDYRYQGPFSSIIVPAAFDRVPIAILAQLGYHGRLVIPIQEACAQYLMTFDRIVEAMPSYEEFLTLSAKEAVTYFDCQYHEEVNFVPLISGMHE